MNTYAYKNQEDVTHDYDCKCPQHSTPIRKEYTFGGRGDSTVVTFTGCTCTVKINGWNEATYYTSYQQAAGSATLDKRHNR